jgi:SNF family Na+-dependent transporter
MRFLTHSFKTWRAASTHVCYTLAIGFGGLLSLSSFNKHTHNCYRDAFIITMADGLNSLFSGTAVFAVLGKYFKYCEIYNNIVLGFMSKQLDKSIDTVIESGTGLIFIAYPEAISRMPMPYLWGFLFFFMLFLLGVASQFGMAEVSYSRVALTHLLLGTNHCDL